MNTLPPPAPETLRPFDKSRRVNSGSGQNAGRALELTERNAGFDRLLDHGDVLGKVTFATVIEPLDAGGLAKLGFIVIHLRRIRNIAQQKAQSNLRQNQQFAFWRRGWRRRG